MAPLANVSGHGSTFCPTFTPNSQTAISIFVSSANFSSTSLNNLSMAYSSPRPAGNDSSGRRHNAPPDPAHQSSCRNRVQAARVQKELPVFTQISYSLDSRVPPIPPSASQIFGTGQARRSAAAPRCATSPISESAEAGSAREAKSCDNQVSG